MKKNLVLKAIDKFQIKSVTQKALGKNYFK